MITTILRQVASLPFMLGGIWFSTLGEALSDISYKIEGVPNPFGVNREP